MVFKEWTVGTKALLWRLGSWISLHRKDNYFVDRTFDGPTRSADIYHSKTVACSGVDRYDSTETPISLRHVVPPNDHHVVIF